MVDNYEHIKEVGGFIIHLLFYIIKYDTIGIYLLLEKEKICLQVEYIFLLKKQMMV